MDRIGLQNAALKTFLIGIAILVMMYAKAILIPFAFAILFAMALLPISKWLERRKIARWIAAFISVILLSAFFAVIILMVSKQFIQFEKDSVLFETIIKHKIYSLSTWIEQVFNLDSDEQMVFFKEKSIQATQSLTIWFISTLTQFLAGISDAVLVTVYCYFFLVYRTKIARFLHLMNVNPKDSTDDALIEKKKSLNKLIIDISKVVQEYIKGVFFVICILSVMNTSVLLLLSVKYAVFLGILAAFLNVIPYIGVLIGSGLAALMAFLTNESPATALWVIFIFWIIQLIENNLLTPKITGGKVHINSFVTIIFLVFGAFIWGISGMILFIPLAGVLKVYFDAHKNLFPFAYLLNTEDV